MERRRGKNPRATARQAEPQQRHLRLVTPRHRCTLLELIQKIQDSGRGDEEVVATISRLIESGRVVLCNAFSGTTANSSSDETRKPPATSNRTTAARSSKIRFAR